MISDLKYFSFLEGLRNSNSLMSYLILPFPLQITEQVFCMKTRNCFPLMVERRRGIQRKEKTSTRKIIILFKKKQNKTKHSNKRKRTLRITKPAGALWKIRLFGIFYTGIEYAL